ncbi:GDP-mannose 4,6-dehydratase [Candidatus Woesebacteria bacterium]|jgi:CDP-paratose 2-epimerase|nr:GDP-mannose 4,6-dehydratase [Candidatus Woesebacteria bacterium]
MKILITGGAGFIGSNAAAHFLRKGWDVTIFDNLSRQGAKKNLDWLRGLGGNLTTLKGNLCKPADMTKLMPVVKNVNVILHLAAQVAVTTSVNNPREDFEINALGTFNMLELMRLSKSNAKLIYSSTNKVYGGMEDVVVVEKKTRYAYKNLPNGASEERPLDFHSPYGCSKGSADQYVHDYSRIYGLDTVVFRQSCIYGPRQFGVEDQGWVAWFIIAISQNKKLSIYGDGKQVRDLLYIDDLIAAYDKAIIAGAKTKGGIFNIGGGAKNTLSVWMEFAPLLTKLFGKTPEVEFHNWRPGDQKIFVADIRKAKKVFGWEPKISVPTGIERLHTWVKSNADLFV